MLTKKQGQLLWFLENWKSTYGECPSYDEMCIGLHLKSKSGVHRLVVALEERGFIRRLPNRARAIELLQTADGACPTCQRRAEHSAALRGFAA
jgi:repressor LexA